MKAALKQLFLLITASWGLVACGYHFSEVEERSLAIPFVEGDRDGSLTQALVHEISLRTSFVHCSEQAGYLLQVKLLEFQDENIGFRYDSRKRGDFRHTVVPVEMRLKAIAEVTLCDTGSGRALAGPAFVEASVSFDHDYYSNHDAVNVFSLGQLTDVDAAREAALRPLHRALARKIADFLTHF